MDDLAKVVAVRKWCRNQQLGHWGANDDSSSDPLALLSRQRMGVPGCCRRFGYVYAGALEAVGIGVRVVAASAGIYDASEQHTMVEAWIPRLNQWVLTDSMYNTNFLVDARPASLLQVAQALSQSPVRVSFDRGGATTAPHPVLDARYVRMHNHLYFSLAGSSFAGLEPAWPGKKSLHFAHYSVRNEMYPEGLKNALAGLGLTLLVLGLLPALHNPLPARRTTRDGQGKMTERDVVATGSLALRPER